MSLTLNGTTISANTVTAGTTSGVSNNTAYNVVADNNGDTINFTTSSVDNNLNGGTGNDTITAGSGNDVIYGGGGNDSLVGGSGSDTIIVGGNAGLTSNSTVKGGTGSDTIDVLVAGNDSITGGTGANGNLFAIGNANTNNPTITATITNLHGSDILKVINAKATVNATVTSTWTADSQSTNNGAVNLSTAGFAVDLSQATGANGWKVTDTSTTKADSLTGTGSDSLIAGTKGDTLTISNGVAGIFGQTGDSLRGGAGVDTFVVNSGVANIYTFGSTDKLTIAQGASAKLELSANWSPTATSVSNIGTLYIYEDNFSVDLSKVTGNFVLLGFQSGNDTIVGGGNRSLTGGTGANTFAINGTGNTITNLGNGTGDIVQIAASGGVTATVTKAWTATSDSYNNGSATLNSKGFAVDVSLANTNSTIPGANGWNVINIGTATVLTGGANDTLKAGAGKDTLISTGGSETLIANAADTLHLKSGAAGTVTITNLGGTDALIIDSGVTYSGKLASNWVSPNTSANSGTVSIDANGKNIDLSKATGVWTITNTSTKATLTGGAGDNLTAGAGKDTLVATAGSETLTGGAGSDTFTVNANATASIVGFNSSDTLNVLAAGVADIALASTVAGQIFDFTALALGTVNLTDASTTGNTFKLDVAATAKEAFNLTQTGTATDTVVGYRTGDVLTATHGSITLNVSGSITTSHDTDLVGVSLINATAKNTSIDLHNQTESFTLGSVGITSLSGDVFTSSQALDHYTVNDAGTGITATTLLKINDVTGVGAAIDYVTGASHTTSALTVGKTTSSSVTFDAKGNVTNFATTPTTLSAALTAIAKAFATEGTTPHLAAANATHGEFAIFKLGTNEYVYISHGNETTSGATDTLIQLVGVTSVSSVDITGIGSGHLVIHA